MHSSARLTVSPFDLPQAAFDSADPLLINLVGGLVQLRSPVRLQHKCGVHQLCQQWPSPLGRRQFGPEAGSPVADVDG